MLLKLNCSQKRTLKSVFFGEKGSKKPNTQKSYISKYVFVFHFIYRFYIQKKLVGDINIKVVIYLATQSSERIKAAILLQFTSNPLLPLPPWKIIQLSHLLISFEDKKR